MTAGPIIIRTAFRSLVARDIRSPVRCAWKYASGSSWRCAKKSLRRSYSMSRDDADEDAPHQEAERRAHRGDGRAAARVEDELPARDAGGRGRRWRAAAPRATASETPVVTSDAGSGRRRSAAGSGAGRAAERRTAGHHLAGKYPQLHAADVESAPCTRSTSSCPSSASSRSPIATTARSSPRGSWCSTTRAATPAHTQYDGHNYYPTTRWVLFGHHFAAIAGAGPLVGPGARRAVRLRARPHLARRGRRPRRRGARLHHPLGLDAARRPVARRDRARRRSARSPASPPASPSSSSSSSRSPASASSSSTRSARAPGARSPSARRSRSPCSWASTCTGSARATSRRRRSSASSACCWRSCSASRSPRRASAGSSRSPTSSWSSRWASTASSPRCCRCGCCSRRATTSARS